MTLQLLLSHALSAAFGAVLLWALRGHFGAGRGSTPATRSDSVAASAPADRDAQDLHERARQLQQQADEERVLREQLREQAAHVETLLNRLRVATQAAGLSAWEMDLRSYKVSWVGNRIVAFGLDELSDEEYPAALQRLIPPEDLAALMAASREAIASDKQTFSARCRLVREGITRHMQTYAQIVRDANGKAVRLLGATTDITNEVQTTGLLQRQAEQERALIDRLTIATEAAGVSSWEIDVRAGEFLWVENPLTNMNDDGPIDQGALDRHMARVHPDDRSIPVDQLRAAASNKRARVSYRYRVLNDDGKYIHVQSHARLLTDDAGRTVRLLGVSWDATKEVEAAEKLEAQSRYERNLLDRLSMATEAAGIGCWEVDMDAKRFVLAEHTIRALHGVLAFSGTIDEFFAHIHPDDRQGFMDAVRQTIKAKSDRFSFRYRVPVKHGIVHIQTHARLVFDETGWARRLLGVSWDVTKEIEAAERLRQQAQALRDAERRTERASRSSSEGHWESDLIGENIWFSSSYHALLGYRDGELPRAIREFELTIHPDDLQLARDAMRSHIIDKGPPFNFDVRMRMKNGQYRWFRQRGMAERDASDRALSMAGSIHDIHEQKLAEVALRRAQQRFERAINGTQDGLWELESDGAAWCSPRVAELLGHGPDELASDTNFLRLFLHPDDADAVTAATQAHFQEELPYDVEIRLQTRSGDYRWYRARATAERDSNGRPLRLSGSLQDVTDARAAREDLLQATEAAEAASRTKSEFLANVSHEIRTPMNGIIGMTGLLLDTALDRTQRDYAETIRTSADSLLIVINDILDFSKIEAGKLDIEAIDVDLRGNVEDVASMMAFQAAAKNLELVVHVHPDVPDRAIGDPQRIRQCLINLVGNAIKFTRQGEIVIEVRNAGRENDRVLTQFEVRDTGIGVAPDVLQTLFQPFVQADSSTTRHFGGTGLGLSIVRRLVEMMGGQVGAHSAIGTGSSFWFTLPLEPVAQATSPAAIDLTRLGRRVLVVDDNETNRRVLAGQLMHAGYEVSLAAGGSEAISLLRQAIGDNHPFEVVLADYKMHDMDGAALGERINSDPQLSRARVVMLTSMDRHGDIHRFASLGFAAYLTKPVRARELFACMDRVLARDSREWHMQSQPIVTRGSLVSEQRRYTGSVLLVEDNAVNQKVAVRFLERMGLKVRVADNGVEGVKACGEATFDIILMDLQMPVMDGFTATRRIRELETGSRQTPIVALTANAMSGQLERCLQAGMNGFLTKPLQIARLHEILDRYGLGMAAEPAATETPSDGDTTVPVNLALLNEITQGDPEFAHELAMTFVASGEQVMQEVRAALDAFDRPALSRAAHKLKGASANVHADPLRDLAYALETQAPSLDQPRLKELIGQLTEEFARAAQFLRDNAAAPAAKTG